MKMPRHSKHQVVAVALVTNELSVFIKLILTLFESTEHFGWCLGSDILNDKNPAAVPLQHCSESTEAKPEKSLMIGDSITDF